MFAARCLGVSLAVFVLLYLAFSFAVSRGWNLLWRLARPVSARGSADLLLAMRLFPLAASLVFTLGITLPSFLWLEPRATDEAIGTAPMLLGVCCLLLLALGVARSIIAHLKTSQAVTRWLADSSVMESDAVPVFRSANHPGALTVAGVHAPRVFVSDAAAKVLTPAELRIAVKHEIAHVRRYDNLKKLLFRFSVFPGMSDLEHQWDETAEMAADDWAVSSVSEALDLAAALIKVSRLGPAPASPALATGLLHTSTALTDRIHRLFAWDRQSKQPSRFWWYSLPPAFAAIMFMVSGYSTVLIRMHAITEWLVR